MQFIAKRYDNDKMTFVETLGSTIKKVRTPTPQEISQAGISVETAPIIGPGFFDIQINGGGGVEFSSENLTEEEVVSVFDRIIKQGVFRFCPTVTTNAPAIMAHAVGTIVAAVEHHPEYSELMAGIHLEGPFISRQDGPRGAHPIQWCCPCNNEIFDEIQKAARGLIRIVTLSPEYENASEFIEQLNLDGILVATGHTNATPNQIVMAADAGAKLATHLSNATYPLLPKWENYFFAQLTEDRLTASVIADCFHVSPMLLRIIAKTKGLNRLVLVSDQASVAGLPPGRYTTNLCDLEILPNGKVAIADNKEHLLAGASASIATGMVNMMTAVGLTLAQAYPLATTNPAALLDVEKYSNGNDDFLKVGAKADFILFDVKPACFGEYGLADSANFRRGELALRNVVYRGKDWLV